MDVCRRFHKGADTSELAYAETPARVRSKLRYKVLSTIKARGNATCDEIESLLDLSHQSCSARVTELKRDGLIEDTGEKRLTRQGRKARVYKPMDEDAHGV